jgi:hypothetical protein
MTALHDDRHDSRADVIGRARATVDKSPAER